MQEAVADHHHRGPGRGPGPGLIQRDFASRPGTDLRYAGDTAYVMTWAYLSGAWNPSAEGS